MSWEEMLILGDEETLTRFWNKIHIPNPNDPNACWEWTAYRDRDGCGKFGIKVNDKHKGKRAPRLMWILEHEQDIPNGMQVQHTCDDEGCTNPKHLKLGTHYDNAMDRKARGRFDSAPKGEKHPHSKLTEKKVVQVCKDYFHQKLSISNIARKYKVCSATIRSIIIGETWVHITKTHRPQQIKLASQRVKERKEKMYQLYDQGVPYTAIASQFGFNVKYVIDIIRAERKKRGEKVRIGNRQINRKRKL